VGINAIRERLTRILEEELVPLPVEKLIDRFKATGFYRDHEEELDDGFILACLRVDPEICIDDEECGLRKWERHRLDEMILALREIGEPAHYTRIAETTNALLEPEMQTSAHNILAHMYRLPDIFVRVGHGVYGLAEWDLHGDGSLANAAHRVMSAAGKPLHYDVIADRVLKTWKARRSSVYVALNTDDRFVRIGPGVYWLREKIAESAETGEADFGDLFGDRLEERQEEITGERSGRGYDTHAEADAIRQMGTDFFS
jgi:DNA-directed RNA polymerase delta subunit